MDFNQVRYFLALVDTLNFTRAAEKCHVSQSALTQAIRRMETELNGDVVYRKGKQTELTKLGRALCDQFSQIEKSRRLITRVAHEITSENQMVLNIGVMNTLGSELFTGCIISFQKKYPEVTIYMLDVEQDSIEGLLQAGILDGAFWSTDGKKKNLNHIKMFDEEMVVAFSSDNPLCSKKNIDLIELADFPYIDRVHCEFRDKLFSYCDERKVELNVIFRSQREDWVQSMIRGGVGVSVIPLLSILKQDLVYRNITNPKLSRTIKFSTADSGKLTMPLGNLIDHIKSLQLPTSSTG